MVYSPGQKDRWHISGLGRGYLVLTKRCYMKDKEKVSGVSSCAAVESGLKTMANTLEFMGKQFKEGFMKSAEK